MYKLLSFLLIFAVASMRCGQHREKSPGNDHNAGRSDTLLKSEKAGRGEALLLTQYNSLEELKSVIRIKYLEDSSGVCLSHRCRDREVTTELKPGVDQNDFVRAANGNFWDQLWLGLRCPYAAVHKKALMSIENLGRRKNSVFGHGDVAFFDLAETMVHHISDEDTVKMSAKDLSEKGYLNTFNHVIAQALMTSIYSESIADFVADIHERYTMPELMTGRFTQEQLDDIEEGPVDNYLDMINNEWGQELGKVLRRKYNINRRTSWTPELLADYLNDIQTYHSWVFQIGFKPFTPAHEIVVRYAGKMNIVI